MDESPSTTPSQLRDPRDVRIVRIIDSISDGAVDHLSVTAKGFFTLTLSAAGIVVAFFWLVGVLCQAQVLEQARLPWTLLSIELTTGVARGYLVLLHHISQIPLLRSLLVGTWFALPLMFFTPALFAWAYIRIRPAMRRHLRKQFMIRRSTLRKGIYKHARFYVAYFWAMQKFAKFYSYYVIVLMVSILAVLPPIMSSPVAKSMTTSVAKAAMAACKPGVSCLLACVDHRMRRHIVLIGDSTLTVFRLDGNSYRVVKNEDMPTFQRGPLGAQCGQ